MIDSFETGVRIDSNAKLFTFVDRNSREHSYTYGESRLIAAALARKFLNSGIVEGDTILVDLPNCPEFIFVALACAYGGFTMVLMDNSLASADKLSRRLEVERAGFPIAMQLDYDQVRRILSGVRQLSQDPAEIIMQISGRSRRGKAIMGESQDVIDDTIHFAEREAHLFNREQMAIILFADNSKVTSDDGRTKARAVPLTWEKLQSASQSLNEHFNTGASRLWQERLPFNSFSDSSNSGSLRSLQSQNAAIWQCAMPLHTIDGFQTFVRSVMARTPFTLYTGLDPEQLLSDVERGVATHIAVDDIMLQDLTTIEEWRNDAVPGISSRLALYKGVMLVGRTRSSRTIRRAFDLRARVIVGYGLPQTSGQVALSQIASDFKGGLAPLPGYDVCVIDPDEDGSGRLGVKGVGVFERYLSSRTPFTVDHFFMTDDKAIIENGMLFVQNRAENMFVSAGQNIYPVEIADVLRHVDGVRGVHVFGVPDSRCGMLPIAVLERERVEITPQYVEERTRSWFASFTVPISVFVFDELPRDERGKLNRSAIEAFFSV